MSDLYRYGNVTRIYPGMPANDGDDNPFVVDGAVHRSTTLLYGQTLSGKSTLAASIGMAIAGQDQTWLGKKKIRRHGHVLIVAGDQDRGGDYRRRLRRAGADNMDVYAPYKPAIPDTWGEVALMARSCNSALVVIDNLSAFVPGTLSDDARIKEFYEYIDGITQDGAAVLIIAHVSEKIGERGSSRLPMGSSLIRFSPRWWCFAHRSYGKLLLDFDGNDLQPWQLAVTEPDDTLEFRVLSETTGKELAARKRTRGKEKLDRNAAVAAYWHEHCEGKMTQREAGEKLAAEFGGKPGTHQVYISRIYSKITA